MGLDPGFARAEFFRLAVAVEIDFQGAHAFAGLTLHLIIIRAITETDDIRSAILRFRFLINGLILEVPAARSAGWAGQGRNRAAAKTTSRPRRSQPLKPSLRKL